MEESTRIHEYWRQRLQAYLDGTLPRKEAVKLFLYAEKHSDLQAELDQYRELFSSLDAAPVEEPSPLFDERVLARIPYEKYETAPRRALPVLTIGAEAPSLLARLLRPMRNGLSAAAAAYVLFLVVSHSFLAKTVADAAAVLGEGLGRLAAGTNDVPVVSVLVGSLARAYDAVTSSVAALGSTWGGGVVTILLGLLVGGAMLGAVALGRRRQEAKRTHV